MAPRRPGSPAPQDDLSTYPALVSRSGTPGCRRWLHYAGKRDFVGRAGAIRYKSPGRVLLYWMSMVSSETKPPASDDDARGCGKELPPFVPRPNTRLPEDEQRRYEKKVRAHLHDAVMKSRGKQWALALADIERAMKLCMDLGWKEAITLATSLRDSIMQQRSASAREENAKKAQERFNKRRMERQQREAAERARLEALAAESNQNKEKLKEFVAMAKAAKKIDIASLATALNLDEQSALARATELASQFGFKVDGTSIFFQKGDKTGFLKALGPLQ
ncbi:MAG: hypothetical protein GYA24_13300 [Candidatus Lokiarchaeota archaeon]|nr:hypothetical protein [Candidatus Lokiarchaeota archaeon]